MIIGSDHTLPPYSDRGEAGKRLRQKFLTLAETSMEKEEILPGSGGISVKTLLIDSQRWPGVEEYIKNMTPPISEPRQWGGWAELLCLASLRQTKVLLFIQCGNDSIGLACGAYGHPHPKTHLCLLWSGVHYDALKLSPFDLETFTAGPSK